MDNFDYYRIQSDAYAQDKTPQWVEQDSDVDEYFYDLLTSLTVQHLDTYQLSGKLALKANTDLSLLHINARSIRKNSKVANIKLSQLKLKFSVIAVTETWTTDDSRVLYFFQDTRCFLSLGLMGLVMGGLPYS